MKIVEIIQTENETTGSNYQFDPVVVTIWGWGPCLLHNFKGRPEQKTKPPIFELPYCGRLVGFKRGREA